MKPTAQDVYKTWREMYANHQKMGRTILKLLAHPDATPEQIAQVRELWMRVVQDTRMVRESVLHVLRTKYSGFRVRMMIDQIEQETRYDR